MRWPVADLDNVPGVPKNPCFVLMLSLMKTVTPWKTKMNQEEGFVSIGGPFFKPASRARDITSTKISCGMFRKLLTISVGTLHLSQRCISSRQMSDNIFEIETIALAHVACAPQESCILLTDFAAAYPSVNHSWILSVIEKTELPDFICRFLRRQHHARGIRGSNSGTNPCGQRCKTRLSRERLSFCNGIRPDLQMAPR